MCTLYYIYVVLIIYIIVIIYINGKKIDFDIICLGKVICDFRKTKGGVRM